jgi:hypothetical protein
MLTQSNKSIYFLIPALLLIFSCSGGAMEQKKTTFSNLQEVPDKTWETLSKKKIYFGHQSVGLNILNGVQDLMKEHTKIKLNIVETTDSKAFNTGILAHSRVGRNLDPKVKIADFSGILEDGLGKKSDIAALKFCYLDMTKKTDIPKLFEDYKAEIERLKKKYPDLTIVHYTAPLTVSKTSWKTRLKKILGKKEFWEFDDNIKRNQYNQLLKEQYQGKDPILDIAEIESTKPDGSRQSFKLNGVTYYSMFPGYTKDGGHLNEIGRKKVAEHFVLLLTNLT